MTGGPVPVEELLECIDARERAVVDEAEQVRAEIDALTTRLCELDQEAEHLRIIRKTTLGLAAGEPDAGPAPQEPVALPSHPAYRQILAVLTETPGPMRARDLCQALDLPLAPKHIEGIRCKLKRLVDRGILAETEPGLFTQRRP
ncbi:hypothetical protein [Streptomyces sp. NPDC059460]|uniref:hypothetical protein n=1 Tax=Streptomyces sp. NPDC059460 TaxID=3346840 RepID=UPI00368106A8